MSIGVTERGARVHVCQTRRAGWPAECPFCGPVAAWLLLYEARWHGFARWVIEQRETTEDGAVELTRLSEGWWRPPTGWRYRELRFEQLSGGGSRT